MNRGPGDVLRPEPNPYAPILGRYQAVKGYLPNQFGQKSHGVSNGKDFGLG